MLILTKSASSRHVEHGEFCDVRKCGNFFRLKNALNHHPASKNFAVRHRAYVFEPNRPLTAELPADFHRAHYLGTAKILELAMLCVRENPLDNLDDQSLYTLLGEAWLAQLQPEAGKTYYLGPPEEMGRREFEFIRVQLRHALRNCTLADVLSRVTKTVRFHSWRMPASVVAALAVRSGLAGNSYGPSQRLSQEAPRQEGNL